jgi:hypothetical protein
MAEQPNSEELHTECPGGLHAMCCHLIPSISETSDGGLRVDWNVGAALCACPCHAECPMTGSGASSDWPGGCTCPGTVAHVRRKSRMSSSLGETLRTSIDQSRRQKKAQEELRRQASGRSVEEVDQMVDEIWAKYGLPAPVGPARPWIIDRARNPPGYASQVRTTAEIIAGSARFISGLVDMFREDSTAGREDTGAKRPSFYVQSDTDAVEVVLDDGTQELVGSQTDGIFTSRLLSTAKVSLRGNADSVEVWTRDGTHDGRPLRLGTVPREEGARYLPLLRAAERVGEELVCPALRAEGPEGQWHLYVKLPQTSSG